MIRPDEHPFGKTEYKNYDPEQINNAQDVLELFRWVAGQNRDESNHTAANVFHECADVVEKQLVDDES